MIFINFKMKISKKTCFIVEKSRFHEKKLDFQNFRNILDKVKYPGPNLLINSLLLTLFSKIQIFANNRLSALTEVLWKKKHCTEFNNKIFSNLLEC